jgi:hypothetical protein
MNRIVVAVTILADAAAMLQFEKLGVGIHNNPPCCFRVCYIFFMIVKCALKFALIEVWDVEELEDAPQTNLRSGVPILLRKNLRRLQITLFCAAMGC